MRDEDIIRLIVKTYYGIKILEGAGGVEIILKDRVSSII